MNDPNKYPQGWDAERVKKVIEHYDSMTDEELADEDDAALSVQPGQTIVAVPDSLMPAIRKLLAEHQSTTAS
jgi:hypothetical protein